MQSCVTSLGEATGGSGGVGALAALVAVIMGLNLLELLPFELPSLTLPGGDGADREIPPYVIFIHVQLYMYTYFHID